MAVLNHPSAPPRWSAGHWRRLRVVCLLLAYCGCSSGQPAQAQSVSATEYQVKAAFLYNFGRFVEWPAEAFPAGDAPLQICVVGENPFGSDLEEIIRGKMIAGHPVHAVILRRLGEARNCHILFVSSPQFSQSQQTLEAAGGYGVLVVSEGAGFADRGSMINFVVEDDRVRFEINAKAAAAARLRISSKLLMLASKVIN